MALSRNGHAPLPCLTLRVKTSPHTLTPPSPMIPAAVMLIDDREVGGISRSEEAFTPAFIGIMIGCVSSASMNSPCWNSQGMHLAMVSPSGCMLCQSPCNASFICPAPFLPSEASPRLASPGVCPDRRSALPTPRMSLRYLALPAAGALTVLLALCLFFCPQGIAPVVRFLARVPSPQVL